MPTPLFVVGFRRSIQAAKVHYLWYLNKSPLQRHLRKDQMVGTRRGPVSPGSNNRFAAHHAVDSIADRQAPDQLPIPLNGSRGIDVERVVHDFELSIVHIDCARASVGENGAGV
jgi:hypothetical protein